LQQSVTVSLGPPPSSRQLGTISGSHGVNYVDVFWDAAPRRLVEIDVSEVLTASVIREMIARMMKAVTISASFYQTTRREHP
jgi:hypothetical protein